MAGTHLRLEEDRTPAPVQGAQPGDPLRRLPVRHARVVEARRHQQRGIVGGTHVVVRRVALDVRVELAFLRVAPLVVLVDRQRQLVVEHRRQGVDKRDLRDGTCEKIGSHVDDSAHQEPARAPAADRKVARLRVTRFDETLRASDEVGEGVALAQQPTLFVPLPPHLPTAAHMRDGEHQSAVEKAEAGRVEHRVVGVLVRAIAVEQKRSAGPSGATRHLPMNGEHFSIASVDERDGHLHPIRGLRPDALGHIVVAVVAAPHGLLLDDRAPARLHVVVDGGPWRGERRVEEAHHVAVVVRVRARKRGVRRVRLRHQMQVA